MNPSDEVRAACRAVAERAQLVRIDHDALAQVAPEPAPPLDPAVHFLDGSRADVAAYVLALDAVNFGSGWFAELPGFGYDTVAGGLRTRWADEGAWTPAELRALTTADLREVLWIPAGHPLLVLFVKALREMGRWLGARTAIDVVDAAGRSGQALVRALADGMPMWRDPRFLKRAQIAVSDLALAGVAEFDDLPALTAFADNLLPHVLRRDGVLQVDPELEARIDSGELLHHGSRAERELRATAVHACTIAAERLGVPDHALDNALWTAGQAARYQDPPPHRTKTVAY